MTRDERNDRYRRGVCIDCGDEPHSAGRPRCDNCHREHIAGNFEPGLTRPTSPQKKETKRWR